MKDADDEATPNHAFLGIFSSVFAAKTKFFLQTICLTFEWGSRSDTRDDIKNDLCIMETNERTHPSDGFLFHKRCFSAREKRRSENENIQPFCRNWFCTHVRLQLQTNYEIKRSKCFGLLTHDYDRGKKCATILLMKLRPRTVSTTIRFVWRFKFSSFYLPCRLQIRPIE